MTGQSSFNFDLDPLPRPGSFFRWGSQNYQVYERLLAGGITSAEMHKLNFLSHTKRISDVREKLNPLGYDVVCEVFSGKVNVWKIKKMEREAA
ncbi:MAG: hypothetical protein CVU71_03815 [Deltaproteobacteria bacterium HGW-Deltaproteobacteria-6]|jgi:hypothetical protein|nr:MAG: hypothetical protein CVU71_03815 [Deltaproteobacteria bacterium HGW-Deltaproteobacteria-6]